MPSSTSLWDVSARQVLWVVFVRVLQVDQSHFNVQLGPDAWRQLGPFDREAFAAIRRALDDLSREIELHDQTVGRADHHHLRSALVGDLVVVYRVDVRARLVTVVRFAKSLPDANAD